MKALLICISLVFSTIAFSQKKATNVFSIKLSDFNDSPIIVINNDTLQKDTLNDSLTYQKIKKIFGRPDRIKKTREFMRRRLFRIRHGAYWCANSRNKFSSKSVTLYYKNLGMVFTGDDKNHINSLIIVFDSTENRIRKMHLFQNKIFLNNIAIIPDSSLLNLKMTFKKDTGSTGRIYTSCLWNGMLFDSYFNAIYHIPFGSNSCELVNKNATRDTRFVFNNDNNHITRMYFKWK